MEEVGQIWHDDVGAILAQALRVAHAVDADDVPETSRTTRCHTGEGVLEHHRLG